MIFAAPWVLLALIALPVLWWLLRAAPPAPRTQSFPALILLAGLRPREETPARTPPWLLALRLAAAGLVILGLAGPILGGGGEPLPGIGPLRLVIDNGWSTGPDWSARIEAASAILDRAGREHRRVSLLPTAAGITRPEATPAMAAPALRPILLALQPQSWGTDRVQAAAILRRDPMPTIYLPDGLATGSDAAFIQALRDAPSVLILRSRETPRTLSAAVQPDGLYATVEQVPTPAPRREAIMAETGDGRVLARPDLDVPPGAHTARVRIDLPAELRNQLGALRLAGSPGAGSVALLDEGSRRRPVGVLASGPDTPLLGETFYLDRALETRAELRHGSLATLLSRPIAVLAVANRTLSGDELARADAWVRSGGLLLRFAGPDMGQDPLLPAHLLAGDRQLGGAMSWSTPQRLAPFPPGPFAGLKVPPEVTVRQQVLAEPGAVPGAETWAALADGTPLVTAVPHGAGEIVLFHVTANADWSDLPLSGLFPRMLDRLVRRAAGVAGAGENQTLAPAQILDGAGVLGPAPPGAQPLTTEALAAAVPSPAHPPGFYGPAQDRHAFNLGGRVSLAAEAPLPGATATLAGETRQKPLGPACIALAFVLLCLDLLLTMRLRGLLRPVAAGIAVLLIAGQAQAQSDAQSPALATHLAYVVTGDASVDDVSRAGLGGLSDYVNDHTAAVLAAPAAVTPGKDDLSFYPLLYWPVTANAAPNPDFVSALNGYMRHGGIILIDTRSGGGAFAPGTDSALRRASQGLDIPALAPLTQAHVLARSFYLLSEYPGRYEGQTVWVQRDQDRTNDSVSPVIIGANDWAAAWATDDDGRSLFATIPGGTRQRTLAWRFGVNLVMYALTGNYKGDQVHVPAILQRLGQ